MERLLLVSSVFVGTCVALTEVACWMDDHRDAFRRKVIKASAMVVNGLTSLLEEAEAEDDPIMPTEYVDWASSKLWRESCIKPNERRM